MRFHVIFIAAVIGMVLFAPILTYYDPMKTNTDQLIQPPTGEHPLGTDTLGRDNLSRLLYGGRRSLLIALLSTLIVVVPGIFLGLIAGWSGVWVDRVIVVGLDTFLAFPALLLALVCLTVMGQGILPLIVATGLAQVAGYASVIRGAVMGIRHQTFVEAARSTGASNVWIMAHHILPNIRETALSYAGVVFGYSLLNSAALSFLGLGGEPGIPDWGIMLAEGRTAFRTAPWASIAPGLAITLTIMAVNRLADDLGRRHL
ncbi:MAG: ABC transporter permease [Anaerolineae bacterium]|nr:ABC transporter permease [Anaerolineae bacterium]